jgi:hypothetical protein
VVLDLSAPKLLIPENFEDKNAAIIVVDFGKFLLTNQPGEHAPGQTRYSFLFFFKNFDKNLQN